MHHPTPAARPAVRVRGRYSVYTYVATLFISVVALILLSYFSHPAADVSAAELTETAAATTLYRA